MKCLTRGFMPLVDAVHDNPRNSVREVGLALKKLLLERVNWRKITIDHARQPENLQEA